MKYEIPVLKVRMVREGAPIKCDGPSVAATVARAVCVGDDPSIERMAVIYLDGRTQVRGATVVSMGGSHGCAVTTKEILYRVCANNASGFILAHNHPSGSTTPSGEDIVLTQHLRKAADVVGVPLCDHIIVTEDDHFSFLDAGLLGKGE